MGSDHRAFLEATLPYLDAVYQVARQAAGDGQEPDDLVQETYLRAYAGFGSYRGGSMRAYATCSPPRTRCHAARRRSCPHQRSRESLVVLPSSSGGCLPPMPASEPARWSHPPPCQARCRGRTPPTLPPRARDAVPDGDLLWADEDVISAPIRADIGHGAQVPG